MEKGDDNESLDELMTEFRKWPDRPAACSIDICYCKDEQSRMVEANDAYALVRAFPFQKRRTLRDFLKVLKLSC